MGRRQIRRATNNAKNKEIKVKQMKKRLREQEIKKKEKLRGINIGSNLNKEEREQV